LLLGLAAGAGLALWARRAASSPLFGLKPYDPVTLAGAMALLAAARWRPATQPAQRASRLEPMHLLRDR